MCYSWRRFSPTPAEEEYFAHQDQNEETARMRLKLVLAVASLAALVGAGSCIAIVLAFFSSVKPLTTPGLLVALTLLIPTATIIFGSIFVYRHTARRRKLQAFLTAIVATVLTLCLFVVASIISARRNPIEPPQPAGSHVAS
jgi:uncharacterized membrane-anchored protein